MPAPASPVNDRHRDRPGGAAPSRRERGPDGEAHGHLAILRNRFADLPSIELHLGASAEEARGATPALTIYYLGVPDTTPEFDAAPALGAYLDKMVGG